MFKLALLPSIRTSQLLAVAVSLVVGSVGCVGSGDDDGVDSSDIADGARNTLWIHGVKLNPTRTTTIGTYDDFSYFGDDAQEAGVNKIAVNWGGVQRLAESNGVIRNALDCFCTGTRFCYVVGYSAGDLQISYALAQLGGSEREITSGRPDASGKCEGTGEKQIGWNIKFVDIAGGAAGGSELANVGKWLLGPIVPHLNDLRTTVARTAYDHNETRGVPFNHFVGAQSSPLGELLPGMDDSGVAYHSAGAVSDVAPLCNPGDADRGCEGTLEMDEAPATVGTAELAKWANHKVRFRDEDRKYGHPTAEQWGGIVSMALKDIIKYAR